MTRQLVPTPRCVSAVHTSRGCFHLGSLDKADSAVCCYRSSAGSHAENGTDLHINQILWVKKELDLLIWPGAWKKCRIIQSLT